MKKFLIIVIFVAVLLSPTGTSVFASTTLVPADWKTPGDQLLTIDTATGYSWLDLTITDDLTYNQVRSDLSPGGTLEGFRFATLAEVIEIWEHAGIDTTGLPSPTPIVANFEPITAFQELIGITNVGFFTIDSMGLVADTTFWCDHWAPFARLFPRGINAGTGVVVTTASRAPDQVGANFGSWLILDNVQKIEIDIDIKPDSYPNSLNPKSKGTISVSILTSDDFDSTTVDPVTVLFAGANPLRWATEDIDRDGDIDLVFHFKNQELNLYECNNEAKLEGKTFSGLNIWGIDTVKIIQ